MAERQVVHAGVHMLLFCYVFFSLFNESSAPPLPTYYHGDGMRVGDAGRDRALCCKLKIEKVRLSL